MSRTISPCVLQPASGEYWKARKMCPSKDRLSIAVAATFDQALHSFDNLLMDTIAVGWIHFIGGDGLCKPHVNNCGTRLARHHHEQLQCRGEAFTIVTRPLDAR